MELYKKYRPTSFDEMVGQDDTLKMLKSLIQNKRLPHSILLTGPSGCGKTTVARILKEAVNCSDPDYQEINAANFKGIDTIREVIARANLNPMFGKSRIFYFDEAHKLTSDAQNGILKLLEDTPNHVYLFLATTDPNKLLKTILTRCTEIKMKEIHPSEMMKLLQSVLTKEFGAKSKKKISEEVLDKIITASEGSARKALVLLNQIIQIEKEEEQLEAIEKSDSRVATIELARKLIQPRPNWGDVAKILKRIEEEPESVRRLILGYASTVCLGGGHLAPRAAQLLEIFQFNYFDTGKAGLIKNCWDACKS